MKEKKAKEMKQKSTELTRAERQPLPATTPFGFMRRFAGDMERLFEDFGSFRLPSLFGRDLYPLHPESERAWVPEIEVLQNNAQFTVRVDLPGLKRDQVKVELTEELLTLSGERKEGSEEEREGYYRSERSCGSFYRQIPLPAGAKPDTAKAEFKDGVLEITMQAPERESRGRRLEIKDAQEPVKAKAAAR